MKKIILVMGMFLTFAALAPFANATEITFDAFSSGATYTEDEFTLTADDGSEFYAITEDDALYGYYYTGSVALVNDYTTTTTLVATDGSLFDLTSIDLAEAFTEDLLYEATISFIATYADNSTYSFNLTTDGIEGIETFTFGSQMTNLASVSFGENESFQFDNIAAHTVPEPSTILMLVVGMCAWAGARRKLA
ncbi:PEP-CTERM sorting domain-containing protein [uncultured Desulfobacter sp.]|uniref:PEP-CTERM sorting domain-containing protein n=1 Tax=uncultured Desulfobacter sp. TaxID=240139 RepID=UPI002AABB9E0|nr:PEP-CTERM sorting domain-containing protein [uncultured Desulfobacter sp.]